MLRLGKRLSVVVLTFLIVAGHGSVCAGWMPAPETRMACCSDDGPCPMRQKRSHHEGAEHTVTQGDADRCCAASGHRDSAPSPAAVTSVVPLLATAQPLSIVPPSKHQLRLSLATVPIPRTHVSRHVLFSVFLV